MDSCQVTVQRDDETLIPESLRRATAVISMPSTEVFDQQDDAYRESVLPVSVTARVAIEAGSTSLWYKYVGLQGEVIGIDRFGESAPAKELFEYFGITTEKLVEAVKNSL